MEQIIWTNALQNRCYNVPIQYNKGLNGNNDETALKTLRIVSNSVITMYIEWKVNFREQRRHLCGHKFMEVHAYHCRRYMEFVFAYFWFCSWKEGLQNPSMKYLYDLTQVVISYKHYDVPITKGCKSFFKLSTYYFPLPCVI